MFVAGKALRAIGKDTDDCCWEKIHTVILWICLSVECVC
jgi:hypothetical protein